MKLIINNLRNEIEQAKAATIEFQIECGTFFREKRVLRGKTEGEVAEFLKLAPQVILDYESGKEAIPLDQVDALSRFLEIPFKEIMELHLRLEEKIMPSPPPQQKSLDAQDLGKVVLETRKTLFLSLKDLAQLLSKSGFPITEEALTRIEEGSEVASAEFWLSFCSLCHLELNSARTYSRPEHLMRLYEAYRKNKLRIPMSSKLQNSFEKFHAAHEANSYMLSYLYRFSLAFKRRWLK
ncbi:MAG: helix-turn-helix domain-containing protein [Bdellovibrionia bacterium]